MRQGRWRHRGRPVVCLASSAASARLEALVHLEAVTPSELPRDNQLLAQGPSLLPRVPSAVVGRTLNLLFNPAYPQASTCRVVSVARFPFGT